jgi:pimeloyl-ACP methyl ester carboxylesterase
MPRARANGIEIEYEEFGNASDEPVLLIMGLGAQMILWDEAFCESLASRGYRVVRFDNRDAGLSTSLDHLGTPNLLAVMTARLLGQKPDAPYLVSDMAADAAALVDALGIDAAHVVGASMGGMIAQAMAIDYPRRVLSLTSIMSTTGELSLPQPKSEARQVLLSPAPRDREEAIERAVRIFRAIGSPGFPFDEEHIRGHAARSFDRAFNPAGAARQLAAIVASGSRKRALGALSVPTLVIHGSDDPLVPVTCGVDTARSIPGAKLVLIEGMGHDLPRPAWPRIVGAIDDLARGARIDRETV